MSVRFFSKLTSLSTGCRYTYLEQLLLQVAPTIASSKLKENEVMMKKPSNSYKLTSISMVD